MSKDIQEAIKRIKKKLTRKADYDTGIWLCQEDVETILNYIENSIPKEVIEEKIKEVKKLKFEDKRLNGATIDFAIYKFQELLENK